MTLDQFKDDLSRMATGLTKAEAHAQDICIECKKPDPLSRCKSEAGRREYEISGVCEQCFDKMFADEEENA